VLHVELARLLAHEHGLRIQVVIASRDPLRFEWGLSSSNPSRMKSAYVSNFHDGNFF